MSDKREETQVNSAWANGSFYLFAFVTVSVTVGVLANSVPLGVLPLVLVTAVVFVGLIGAFQLRNDDRVSEKGYLNLMKMTYGQLPFIGNFFKRDKSGD